MRKRPEESGCGGTQKLLPARRNTAWGLLQSSCPELKVKHEVKTLPGISTAKVGGSSRQGCQAFGSTADRVTAIHHNSLCHF